MMFPVVTEPSWDALSVTSIRCAGMPTVSSQAVRKETSGVWWGFTRPCVWPPSLPPTLCNQNRQTWQARYPPFGFVPSLLSSVQSLVSSASQETQSCPVLQNLTGSLRQHDKEPQSLHRVPTSSKTAYVSISTGLFSLCCHARNRI